MFFKETFSILEPDSEESKSNWRIKSNWQRPQAFLFTHLFGERCKITCVKWQNENSVVATTDDGMAKLFQFQNGSLKTLQSHCTHKQLSRDKFKINAIAVTKDLKVVTGDEYGNLVIWDTFAQQTRGLTLSKNTILVMKAHPVHHELLAFGCRLGLVYIVNINGRGRIIQKIRAHDEDIQGVDWCHESIPDIFENLEFLKDDDNRHNIIAVSSRDRSLSIWSLKTGGILAKLKIPSTYRNDSPWITMKWFSQSLILVSGAQGELCQWDLSKLTKKSFDNNMVMKSDGSGEEFKVLHCEHQKNLYCMAVVNEEMVLTCGYDRSLVCYRPVLDRLEFNLPTFASRITCMVQNVQDPSVLALGCGDGQIRIWKTNSNKAMFDYISIWQKLNRCEILAMAWHPLKDNLLAFATDEGRIGLVDALSARPQVHFLEYYKHRSSVYNLIYGPSSSNESSEFSLFSLGDGIIMMHQDKRALNIEDIIAQANGWQRKAPSRSEIAFQSIGQKLVGLGCDDGTVEIFAWPNLKIVCTLKSFQKLIQSLAWHPMDPHYLAVASNEFEIHLWKLDEDKIGKNEKGEEEEESIKNPIFTRPDQVLAGHKLRVIQLTWSPYDESKLLSVSYDGTAQVWDISSSKGVANFRNHTGRIFCGMFFPNSDDSQSIITGGDDCMVYGWNVQDQVETMPIKKNTKAPRSHEKQAAFVKENESEENAPIMDNETVLSGSTNNIGKNRDGNKNRKINKKSYFGLSLGGESSSKVYEDVEILMSDQEVSKNEKPHLAFFDDSNFTDFIKHEMDNNACDDNLSLAIWSGQPIKPLLEGLIGHLNEWHINLAASQDYQTWKWACTMIAKQFEEKGNFVKAASYYLMISDITQAIQVLVNANFFQAAVTIAKTRLVKDHPLLLDLYKQWALKSHEDGAYGMEAKCWIAMNELDKAGSALAKTGDAHSLRVASEMYSKNGDKEKARVLAFQAAEAFKTAGDMAGLEILLKNTEIEEVKTKVLLESQ